MLTFVPLSVPSFSTPLLDVKLSLTVRRDHVCLGIAVLAASQAVRSEIWTNTLCFILPDKAFVCVEVLWPSQPKGVISSTVSLPNLTFTGQV